MSTVVRWGIVGAGNISLRFLKDLLILGNHPQGPNKLKHVLAAVGASSSGKAEKYIKDNKLPTSVKSLTYDEIINDKEIDILYIGLPHNLHAPFVIRAIEQGHKNILCEKPITINARELDEVLAVAAKHDVFFMEAMWSRFFPAFIDLQKKLYVDGIIGNVRRVFADFSVRMYDWDGLTPEHRMVNKKLGGGALLDVGIYPVTYSRLFLHPDSSPLDWSVSSELTMDSLTGKEDEVDFISSAIFNNKKHRQQAIVTTSVHTETSGPIVVIEGDLGRVEVERIGDTPSPKSYKIVFYDKSKSPIEVDFSDELLGGEGFFYEAVAAGEALFNGEKQSLVISWDESRKIMGLLDRIRKQNEFVYEQDA